MQDLPDSLNTNKRILVSRNSPLALVVGAAGFLGSHIVDLLLSHNIQVLGVDNLSTGERKNLNNATKEKGFHFVNSSIDDKLFIVDGSEAHIKLPRLDYAFFIADNEDPAILFNHGLKRFLEFVRDTKLSTKSEHKDRPRVVLVSSINLYQSKIEGHDKLLKEAEIRFAKFIKDHKLNGRVVRLSNLYGPRMHFRRDDPLINLIRLSVLGKLNQESSSAEFSSRDLYVEDGAKLVLKSALVSGTAHKIYDGCLINPVSIAEIRQILLDPLWHENKGFKETELPPWITPNLRKTIKELSWKPTTNIVKGLRETVSYLRDNEIEVPKENDSKFPLTGWSFRESEKKEYQKTEEKVENREKVFEKEENKRFLSRAKFVSLGLLVIIILGLVFPILSLGVGALNIRNNLKSAGEAIESGDFEKAEENLNNAKDALTSSEEVISSFAVLKRLGVLGKEIERTEEIINLAEEGIDGSIHATQGSKALFQSTKIISGEDKGDPKPLYERAQIELTTAAEKLSRVKAQTGDLDFSKNYPSFISYRITDLSSKLSLFSEIVERARAASFILPELTGVDGKKSYLVLFQNNLELRPTGGFIGSYGKIDFEKGRLTNILVDDIYNLDGRLQDVIEPPAELKSDLGVTRYFLRDSNWEPDFPTAARQAEFFYKKESGEVVNGVVAIDLEASAKLLGAVSGIDLSEYGEHIDEDNLFERAITHAEANFFPGSQAKKNYLTSLQANLFNKVFYLSKQNWPSIISAMSKSLDQKHVLVYLSDPKLFSYLTSSNWAGVFPRAAAVSEGENSDFLSLVEANMGANKSNYYLERSYKLETSFGKDGEVNHKLRVNYKNNSPSEVFPAGKYKNRMRVYLPVGAKLIKASFGEADITNTARAFSDYGRASYSMLLELNPKESKTLLLEYSLGKNLSFKDKKALYQLEVLKQPGTGSDLFEWNITYPINMEIENRNSNSTAANQEVNISTDLQKDRVFSLNLLEK